MDKYKSDEEIKEEFSEFRIIAVYFMPGKDNGSLSGSIHIDFPKGEESVCGGMEEGGKVSDSFIIYDYKKWVINGKFYNPKITFDKWYPNEVYKFLKEVVINAIIDKVIKGV